MTFAFISFHKLSTDLKIACNRVGYRITEYFHRLKRCRTSFSTNRIKFVFYSSIKVQNFPKKIAPIGGYQVVSSADILKLTGTNLVLNSLFHSLKVA